MEKESELNDVRKLATIAKILDVQPIAGADNIEKVFVRGWQCVAKKGEYIPGELCIYVEIDSIMPDGLSEEKREEWKALNKQMSKVAEEERIALREVMDEIIKENTRPEFEFLRDKKFHIKTRRILGEISQGICFPLEILENVGKLQSVCGDPRWETLLLVCDNKAIPIIEDEDFTEILGVTQYIAPDPAVMGGDAIGELQAVGILISDEERIENLNAKYEEMRKFRYFVTEKLDGTSFAAYLKDGKFGVCGRKINYRQPDDDIPFDKMNVYWKAALKCDLEKTMRDIQTIFSLGNFAFQGELVGEGIQKNLYKLKGQEIRFYNAFNIDMQEYWNYGTFLNIMAEFNLKTVPVLSYDFELPEKALSLLERADVTTTVFGHNPKQLIEGFVYVAKGELPVDTRITRSSFKRLSFKAKSRTFDMNK